MLHPVNERDDAQLVQAAREGDRSAYSTLFERWFDRSFDVAWRILRNNDDAAEVTQDVFLTVWRDLGSLRNPEAFGGWVLRSTRNRALNRLERERRSRATDPDDAIGAAERAPVGVAASTDARPGGDPADALVAASHVALVWDAAEALGERDASILDLHLRHGLEPAEIAEALDVTPNNAHQLLFRLRKKLTGAIRARVLWRDGDPHCDELARVLFDAGVTSFGASAVKVIERHADACPVCTEERAAVLAPEAMFAGVPILAAPPSVRHAVAEHLRSEGVPLDLSAGSPSAATDPATGPGTDPATDPASTPAPGARSRTLTGVGVGALVVLVAALGLWWSQRSDTPEPTVLATQAEAAEQATSPTLAPPAAVGEDAAADDRAGADPVAGPKIDLPNAGGAAAPPGTDGPGLVEPPSPASPADAPPPSPQPPLIPPTTGSGPTDPTTSTTARPDAPQLSAGARTDSPGPPCESFERRVTLTWEATGATEVRLTGPGAPVGPQALLGTTTVCLAPGVSTPASWTITATGPGGSTSQTVSE